MRGSGLFPKDFRNMGVQAESSDAVVLEQQLDEQRRGAARGLLAAGDQLRGVGPSVSCGEVEDRERAAARRGLIAARPPCTLGYAKIVVSKL